MVILIFIPILWLTIGFILISLFGRTLPIKNQLIKILLLSFLYALLFGIGILGGSDAEPGFALPAPVFLAGILDFQSGNDLKFIIRGTLYPLLFWWIFSSFVFTIIHFARDNTHNKI